MTMFLLCLFGGFFGLHKFVEGKVGLGILYLCTGGLFGIGWLIDCIVYLSKWLSAPKPAAVAQDEPPAAVTKEVEIIKPEVKEPEPEPVTPEQYERMRKMCEDIHKEYKELLKEYRDSDNEGKVYILSECYRKLNVMESTVNKYKCYYELDIYDEFEKIEKKARSFINAYIKEEREDGNEDYMIDVIQFSDDLDFISDYIYEKDEKLNRE